MYPRFFFLHFYGVLKNSYKHFISLKGFYWQIHQIDAKSEYGDPFLPCLSSELITICGLLQYVPLLFED